MCTKSLSGLALLLILSCAPSQRPATSRTTGTCGGACNHYVDCKDPADPDGAFNGCVSECREIFSDGQKLDQESLRDYERLECPEAIAFVDG